MSDILVVAKKELKELCLLRGVAWAAFQLLITIGIFGVLLPLSEPDQWAEGHPLLALHFILIPLLLTSPNVADALAGERERKTIETLLTTPLDTKAILVGKGLSIFVFSYAQVLLVVAAGLASLNLYFRMEYARWVLYPRAGLFAVFFVSAALVGLATVSGVFASMRAPSVRTAHRIAQVANLVVLLLILVGVIKVWSTWRAVLTTFAVVCVLNLALGAAALLSFRRERLIVAGP